MESYSTCNSVSGVFFQTHPCGSSVCPASSTCHTVIKIYITQIVFRCFLRLNSIPLRVDTTFCSPTRQHRWAEMFKARFRARRYCPAGSTRAKDAAREGQYFTCATTHLCPAVQARTRLRAGRRPAQVTQPGRAGKDRARPGAGLQPPHPALPGRRQPLPGSATPPGAAARPARQCARAGGAARRPAGRMRRRRTARKAPLPRA